jgi:hypothetical protein
MIKENKYKRGSEWRKWDLHIHSPYTFMNSYTCTDEEFIDELVKNKISAIGLTNYFKFKDEEFLLREKLKENDIQVFLNLEVRLEYQNKEDDCLDFHIVFSDDVEKVKIVKFLNNMSSTVSGSRKKLIDLNSQDDFKNAVLNFDELVNTLNDESLELNGKYLLGFLSRGKGNGRTSTNYEKLVSGTDFLIHSSDNPKNIDQDREFWLSYNKAVLQSSDAHSLDKIGSKFTWIKANPTFEGLKQILYEPKDRVRIQNDKPEQKTDYEVIKSVKIIDPTNTFTSKEIFFNTNLNSIIGGKSSGKSLLLYLLAKTILAQEKFEEISKYENFVEYDSLPDIDFEVTWEDGQVTKLKSDENKRYIEYIPQMFLNNIAEDKEKNISFKKAIDDLLYKQESYKENIGIIYQDIDDIKTKLSREVDTYFTNDLELKRLQIGLSTLGDKKAIENSIENYNAELSSLKLNSSLSEEDEKYMLEINKQILANEEEIRIIQKEIQLNENINKLVSGLNEKLENLITDEFSTLEVLDIHKAILDKYKNSLSKELIQTLENYKKSTFINNDTLIKNIGEIDCKVKESKSALEPYNLKILDQTKFQTIQKKSQEELIKFNNIINKEKEIETQKSKLDINKFVALYSSLLEKYKTIIFLNNPFKNIGTDLELVTNVDFNTDKFYDNFSNFVTKNQSMDKIFDESIFSVKSEFRYKKNEHIENIKKILEKIFTGEVGFNKNKSLKDMTKALVDDYFELTYDLKQGDDLLNHMSPGKKGIILFQLFLEISSSKVPILIDQPEDNLDNRTVYKTLNEFIKNKKIDRQIIMVSHNSNLVVSTDSENIIVANQNGYSTTEPRFDYINGSLEETSDNNSSEPNILKQQGIREHVCEILEGGVEAFKKREEKYNL